MLQGRKKWLTQIISGNIMWCWCRALGIFFRVLLPPWLVSLVVVFLRNFLLYDCLILPSVFLAGLLQRILEFPALCVCFITCQSNEPTMTDNSCEEDRGCFTVVYNLYTTLGWSEWFGAWAQGLFGPRDFVSNFAVFINSYWSLFIQTNRDFVVLFVRLLKRLSLCVAYVPVLITLFFCRTQHPCGSVKYFLDYQN